jgi:CO dehydrogenase maturation factor
LLIVPYVVALAGKGGTGKTTVAGLVVRSLRRAGSVPILAVDADPNTNLDAALGLRPSRTISDVVDSTHGMRDVPGNIPKSTYLEYQLEDCLVEGRGVDLVVMGRPEGPECYCASNHLLRSHLDRLMGAYRSVVVDNEAGMEHLSRRTTRDVDLLLIVSDPTQVGIRTALRIRALVGELSLTVRASALVVNRVAELPPTLARVLAEGGLRVAGLVPEDPLVAAFELEGRSLLDLPDDSAAVAAVERMFASAELEGAGR